MCQKKRFSVLCNAGGFSLLEGCIKKVFSVLCNTDGFSLLKQDSLSYLNNSNRFGNYLSTTYSLSISASF